MEFLSPILGIFIAFILIPVIVAMLVSLFTNKPQRQPPKSSTRTKIEIPPDLLVHPDEECKKQIIKVIRVRCKSYRSTIKKFSLHYKVYVASLGMYVASLGIYIARLGMYIPKLGI